MINADLTYAVKMFVHHDIFRGLLCLNQRKMKRTCQIQVPKPKLNHLFLTIFYSKKTHISVAQFITTDLILTCKNMIYTCFFSPHWSPNTSGKTVSVSYRGHSWSGDGSLDKSVFLGHGGCSSWIGGKRPRGRTVWASYAFGAVEVQLILSIIYTAR